MIVNLITILSQAGTSTIEKIKQNLAASGTNASGKTANSLRMEVTTDGFKQILKIYGRPFFMTVETGRKATPDYKPSLSFVQTIQAWMTAKGVPGSAYAIAQSIHKKGTKLWQDGGRTDIVSNVVNEGLTQQIAQSVLTQLSESYLKHTVNIFNSGRRVNS